MAATAPLLPATRGAVLVVAGCVLLFLLGVLGQINGSSSSYWYAELSELDEAQGLIAGSPKPTRSDEWMVWTPAILSQLRHQPSLPIANDSLGADLAPLLMSIPARHYSMVFRPQLWGFFLFGMERGFAWYWNAKVFGLLLSFFLFFLALLRGRVALAICASLAVSYSSFVQWWFSSPPMLPEMLSSWALSLLGGWTLFRPIVFWKKIVAALVVVFSVVNFALCCYPPFQIPLLHLALALGLAFFWQRRGAAWNGGLYWLGGALLLSAVSLGPILAQCRETLAIVAHTAYPGARHGHGGDMAVRQFFSGLLNFFDGERAHADFFSNTSEAANFFPLWILALFFAARRRNDRRTRTLSIALSVYLIFFTLYVLVGFPEWLSRLTLLSFSTERRSLLGLGLGGLILIFLVLRDEGPLVASKRGRAIGFAAVFLASLGYLALLRSQSPIFLDGRFLLLVATATILGGTYLGATPFIFSVLFAATLLLNNFLVNPIAQGLPSLLEGTAVRHVRAIYERDPTAAWAVYGGVSRPELVIASGARVLNGVKVTPDLKFWRALDPGGQSEKIYNRYAYILWQLPPPGARETRFVLASPDAFVAFVRPDHPVLRRAGLKYVVMPRLLGESEIAGLRLIDSLPASRIYIYRFD